MNYESLSKEHFHLLQNLVHTELNGTVRTIVDKSPGHSGSFVYLIEVALAEKQLSCIAKLTPADFALDDSLQNRVYGSCISSFNTVYRYLEQYQIPLPQLYISSLPSADIPFYCQLMEYLPGQDINTALNTTPEEQQSTVQEFLGMRMGIIHNITRFYDGWVDLAIPHLVSWRDAFLTTLHQNLDGACHEHAFQAAKTTHPNEREMLRLAATSVKAKRIGRKVTLRHDWEKVKIEIMHGFLVQKFTQDETLREMLLATGDLEIIEGNNWGDKFWGAVLENSKWVGRNELGKLLMKVRSALHAKALEE